MKQYTTVFIDTQNGGETSKRRFESYEEADRFAREQNLELEEQSLEEHGKWFAVRIRESVKPTEGAQG